MCKSKEYKAAKVERVASLEEDITNGTKVKVSVYDAFRNGLDQIIVMMDKGLSDETFHRNQQSIR